MDTIAPATASEPVANTTAPVEADELGAFAAPPGATAVPTTAPAASAPSGDDSNFGDFGTVAPTAGGGGNDDEWGDFGAFGAPVASASVGSAAPNDDDWGDFGSSTGGAAATVVSTNGGGMLYCPPCISLSICHLVCVASVLLSLLSRGTIFLIFSFLLHIQRSYSVSLSSSSSPPRCRYHPYHTHCHKGNAQADDDWGDFGASTTSTTAPVSSAPATGGDDDGWGSFGQVPSAAQPASDFGSFGRGTTAPASGAAAFGDFGGGGAAVPAQQQRVDLSGGKEKLKEKLSVIFPDSTDEDRDAFLFKYSSVEAAAVPGEVWERVETLRNETLLAWRGSKSEASFASTIGVRRCCLCFAC